MIAKKKKKKKNTNRISTAKVPQFCSNLSPEQEDMK